jgi:menaquinone-dependent protoporphyrinogen oxidase
VTWGPRGADRPSGKEDTNVSIRILVAYASKHGATAEIAERIGAVLRAAGLWTDVEPVTQVAALAPYQAVVLGSAVYMGRWRAEARRFLAEHRDDLAARDLWIFSSGPTGRGDPKTLTKGWALPSALQHDVEYVKPHDVALFHGALDPAELAFFERWIVRRVGAPEGDYRDPEAIDAWASGIVGTLRDTPVTSASERPTRIGRAGRTG